MEQSFYHEYALAEADHWWFEGRRAILRNVMRKWLPKTERLKLLDVGCGPGGMLDLLTEFGEVHALDDSEDALGYCRERLGSRVALHKGSVLGGLPDGVEFDVITAFDVIEHVRDGAEGLRSLRAALKRDGLLFCTVPAYKFLWSIHDDINHHFRRYTAHMLREELVAAGFSVQYISYFNSLLFLPIAAARLLGRLFPTQRGSESDLSTPHHIFNTMLTSVFGIESHLLRAMRFPFGVSILAVASPTRV